MNTELRNAIEALVLAILAACATTPPAPTSGRLVQQSDLHYQGAFRLPRLDALQYGGSSLAYHDGQLLVQGRGSDFYDVTAPAPLNSSNYFELPQAELVHSYCEVVCQSSQLDSGLARDQNPYDTTVRGVLFVGPTLMMTVATYYDATNAQVTSHLRRIWSSGLVTAHTLPPVGHTAGFMSLAAGELAPALTGNFGLPIVTRESFGPAAFIFDPADLSKPAVPVLDYPGEHPLGPWDGQSDLWNSDSRLGGMHQVGQSLLFIGRHGLGPFCYGEDACGDKESNEHGTHSYPYTLRIWAYDSADLVAVKRDEKKPWEPRPYGLWNLNLPLTSTRTRFASAFDLASRRLFILQGFGDQDQAQGFPVVNVYTVEIR